MATLNLFPSRVRWVDENGLLTPAAVRALTELAARSGGQLGDLGLDSFSEPFAANADISQISDLVMQFEAMSMQHVDATSLYPIEQQRDTQSEVSQALNQPETASNTTEMVFATESNETTPIVAVTPSGSPFAYIAKKPGSVSVAGGTVTAISITRNGTAVTLGATAGLFTLSTGDTITVAYVVAPTIDFIPR